jgi:hypothetical protein
VGYEYVIGCADFLLFDLLQQPLGVIASNERNALIGA